jgi:hypothetical protein
MIFAVITTAALMYRMRTAGSSPSWATRTAASGANSAEQSDATLTSE